MEKVMALGKQKKCPLCKTDKLRRDIKKTTFRYKTKSKRIAVPAWYCDACGEGFLTTKDMKAVQKEFEKLIGKK